MFAQEEKVSFFFSVSVVISPEHQTHSVPDPSFIGRKVQRSGAG
jgi:hypothetical protein